MKLMMLLLISTVSMLVGAAVASPTRAKGNLNRIIELAENYSKSVTEEFFVEDVLHLAESKCEDAFFCKVNEILHGHKHFGKRNVEQELVRNLEIFIHGKNCTVLLEGVTSTGISRTIPQLMEYLKTCIRKRNLSKLS